LLAPTLAPGQVVVMDNLGAHRPKRIRELIKERGCELLYLPSYSPDLNPIEEALSKIKHLLRKIAARTKEALVEAIGRALTAVSAEDVRGFFVHCAATALRRSNYERRCKEFGTMQATPTLAVTCTPLAGQRTTRCDALGSGTKRR
jgi:transposase